MATQQHPHDLRISLSAFSQPLALSQAPFEFHIRGTARRTYQCDAALFSISGNAILPDFRSSRLLADAINTERKKEGSTATVRAGDLNAMGLIDEIFHYVVRLYEESANRGVFRKAFSELQGNFGPGQIESLLLTFTKEFPPANVYQGRSTGEEWLRGKSEGREHTDMTVEELMLLWLANFNPAFRPFHELFDDRPLAAASCYDGMMASLAEFFRREPVFGPESLPLLDLLCAPILAHPHSLELQLKYIRDRWGMLLAGKFHDRLLGSLDLIGEESRLRGGGGPAPAVVPDYSRFRYGGSPDEYERFTTDIDWMPRVVLLAKNTYVWLYQLTRKYGRRIEHLDQIPDEELDILKSRGFTGLWLIGVWERSPASRTIKQLTGNPEAVPSAYSLYDYRIAGDLGGEEAFASLKGRAWQRGIRLAGDMVPNHMGIDSDWVVNHPDYFIQSDLSPYPSYRFSGPNLSTDPRVELRIEDGYWRRSDAAVVFEWKETATGRRRYLYHGNDGTNMPWNDTAQLDLLKPEVREAVMQSILAVARRFPIIRFDAAMTLAKKHFQRLWYPQLGTGGAIPSRSEHAMTQEEFDRRFPVEFWREVVDRINAVEPETLLLAEAFWLMEGYFVRTLGMHRVYNSAFMHMLMHEENGKYRQLLKNTLAFNPEILRRYVNFMSNPDEETAIAQFGKGDKYFGVALLMVTLPGLPMFAHGQIEGLTEKYGMEYKRSYYDEMADESLVRRHEWEIFPILHKRYLFSQVDRFEVYDFHDRSGFVNENVFAYSNASGNERALILYLNCYEESSGWIRESVPRVRGSGGERQNAATTLGDALGISGEKDAFYILRDSRAALEYLRKGKELRTNGLYVELRAFQSVVFTSIREVRDVDGEYAQLAERLGGRGVYDVAHELEQMRLGPLKETIRRLLARQHLREIERMLSPRLREEPGHALPAELVHDFESVVHAAQQYLHSEGVKRNAATQQWKKSLAALSYIGQTQGGSKGRTAKNRSASTEESPGLLSATSRGLLASVLLTACAEREMWRALGGDMISHERAAHGIRLAWREAAAESLGRRFPESSIPADVSELSGLLSRDIARPFSVSPDFFRDEIERLLRDYGVAEYIRLNWYEGKWYFHQERFELLVESLALFSAGETIANSPAERSSSFVQETFQRALALVRIARQVGFEPDLLLDELVGQPLNSRKGGVASLRKDDEGDRPEKRS